MRTAARPTSRRTTALAGGVLFVSALTGCFQNGALVSGDSSYDSLGLSSPLSTPSPATGVGTTYVMSATKVFYYGNGSYGASSGVHDNDGVGALIKLDAAFESTLKVTAGTTTWQDVMTPICARADTAPEYKLRVDISGASGFSTDGTYLSIPLKRLCTTANGVLAYKNVIWVTPRSNGTRAVMVATVPGMGTSEYGDYGVKLAYSEDQGVLYGYPGCSASTNVCATGMFGIYIGSCGSSSNTVCVSDGSGTWMTGLAGITPNQNLLLTSPIPQTIVDYMDTNAEANALTDAASVRSNYWATIIKPLTQAQSMGTNNHVLYAFSADKTTGATRDIWLINMSDTGPVPVKICTYLGATTSSSYCPSPSAMRTSETEMKNLDTAQLNNGSTNHVRLHNGSSSETASNNSDTTIQPMY